MTTPSRGSTEFWRLCHRLPIPIRKLARKNYRLWSEDSFHPSLHFKPLRKPLWSVRVGDHYRAVGGFEGNAFLWEWIGSHEEFNKRF